MGSALFALAVAHPLFARESVCLNTGFCLAADSHTLEGGVFVLRTGGGTMELPSNQIAAITVLPDLPNTGNSPPLGKPATGVRW